MSKKDAGINTEREYGYEWQKQAGKYEEQKRWWLIIKHMKRKTQEMVEEEKKLLYAAENGYNRKL